MHFSLVQHSYQNKICLTVYMQSKRYTLWFDAFENKMLVIIHIAIEKWYEYNYQMKRYMTYFATYDSSFVNKVATTSKF